MKRVRLDSTSIASIGFEPRKHELEIEFRESGDVYLYLGVPPEEHAAFMAAESKGEYLNQVFKPRGYRYMVKRRGRS
jgi:KTSC domain